MAGRKKLKREDLLVASLAREHTEAAIKKLVSLMNTAVAETAQIQAANALLDRGWGKPAQEMTINEGETAIERIVNSFADDELDGVSNGLRLLAIAARDREKAAEAGLTERPDKVH